MSDSKNGAADEATPSLWHSFWRFLRPRRAAESVRDALEELIEEREEAEVPIDEHEKRLLGNILHLHDLTASDVMVPRANVVGLDIDSSLDDLVQLIQSTGHSRYPVFRENLDDTVGLVHIQDVLILVASGKPYALQRIIRKVLFVAPSMRVPDLLLEMRLKRTHMALVVDEYGGTDGLVTIEDLVEQIVGDIEDEHDREPQPDYVQVADGIVEVDAHMPLAEFESRVGSLSTSDESDDIDTLGGLVFFLAGRVPSRGELIAHPSGLEFEVVDADPRRVKRLRVRNIPAQHGD